MRPDDQKQFVTELCDSVRDEVIKDIEHQRVPPHWCGRQLRQLLADRFKRATVSRTRDQAREYKNEVLIHNL